MNETVYYKNTGICPLNTDIPVMNYFGCDVTNKRFLYNPKSQVSYSTKYQFWDNL